MPFVKLRNILLRQKRNRRINGKTKPWISALYRSSEPYTIPARHEEVIVEDEAAFMDCQEFFMGDSDDDGAVYDDPWKSNDVPGEVHCMGEARSPPATQEAQAATVTDGSADPGRTHGEPGSSTDGPTNADAQTETLAQKLLARWRNRRNARLQS